MLPSNIKIFILYLCLYVFVQNQISYSFYYFLLFFVCDYHSTFKFHLRIDGLEVLDSFPPPPTMEESTIFISMFLFLPQQSLGKILGSK